MARRDVPQCPRGRSGDLGGHGGRDRGDGDGERTVLGAATGPSEDHQFWTSFLRGMVKRDLRGMRLVISDAHEGLRQAIAKILHGATWQSK